MKCIMLNVMYSIIHMWVKRQIRWHVLFILLIKISKRILMVKAQLLFREIDKKGLFEINEVDT